MGKSDKNIDKSERRFSQEQYDMLKRCSEKKDMTEWNEWREEHPDEEIWLEGADFQGLYLKGVLFETEPFSIFSGEVNLENANFHKAHLEGANLRNANLKRTNFDHTHLEGADIGGANLESAYLYGARLEGAGLSYTHLKDANFETAIVDGGTRFWRCKVSHDTDFRAVGLGNAMIAPGTRQLLEHNIRRKNWEDWYRGEKAHKPFGKIEKRKERWLRACQVIGRLVLTSPVRLFWWMSDYGMSTVRVIGVFFLLAFLFAAVYMNWGYWRPPGIVHDLVVQPEVGEAVWHYFGRALIRPVYFSIVTMTTLGFGDMYANKGSIEGHVILAVQVILGYVLLGALITRFAVLFTAGGPAGKFAESGKGPD